jgi:hypothetical protein
MLLSDSGLQVRFANVLDEIQVNCSQLIVREDYSADGDAWSRKFLCVHTISSFLMLAPRQQTFLTNTLDQEPSGGVKMALLGSQIHLDCKTLLLHFGTKRSM